MQTTILLILPLVAVLAVFILPDNMAAWRKLSVAICCLCHAGVSAWIWVGGDKPLGQLEEWVGLDAAGKLMLTASSAAFLLYSLYLQGDSKRDPFWNDSRREKRGLATILLLLWAVTETCLAQHNNLFLLGVIGIVLAIRLMRRLEMISTVVPSLLPAALIAPAFLVVTRADALMKGPWPGGLGDNFVGAFGLCFMFLAVVLLFRWVKRTTMTLLQAILLFHFGAASSVYRDGGKGVWAGMHHLIGLTLVMICLGIAASNIARHYQTDAVDQITGLRRSMPVTGAIWFAGLVAACGLPPFALFLSGFTLTAVSREWYFILIPGGVMLYFVMSKGLGMLRGAAPDPELMNKPEQKWLAAPAFVAIALALVLGLGVPQFLGRTLNNAAQAVDPTFTTLPGIRP